jgi:poly(A) polymerase
MRRVLAELQTHPLLQRLQEFAERRDVDLYAVGGTLRDICLGRPVQDIDLVMGDGVLDFTKGFARQLGAAYVPMDVARGEVRVVYRKRHVFDFSRMRGATIISDLQGRDFTINAMACQLRTLLSQPTPPLIDPHGGWHDLQARAIRMVSPLSFRDDPLRLLRAFRLAATLDLTIDSSTLAAMGATSPRLAEAAAERIHSELFKLFAAPQSGPHIAAMADAGLLDVLFPELAATHGIRCHPGAKLDVFEHSVQTYQVVEGLIGDPGLHLATLVGAIAEHFRAEERRASVKWAALLHALQGGVVCHGQSHGYAAAQHGIESARRWEQIGNRLKLSRKQIDSVMSIITHYGHVLDLAHPEAQAQLTVRSVHRWCKEVGDHMLEAFVLAVGHALAGGGGNPQEPGVAALGRLAAHVWEIYRSRILPVITGPRLVTGDDLQQHFRLAPGPRFKTLLEGLEVAQVEGDVRSRTEALQWITAQLGTHASEPNGQSTVRHRSRPSSDR